MKKTILSLLIGIIVLTPLSVLATNIPGYEGGIQNESEYKEVIFVTGKPIVMEGTVSISIKEKGDSTTESYRYKLTNLEEEASLDRNITVTGTSKLNENQLTSTRTIDKYSETINIDGRRYEVKHDKKNQYYPWNLGVINYKTPLLEYHSGTMSARKTYKIDGGAERLIVESQGELVGYNSPWSATETQSIEHIIKYEDIQDSAKNWEGSATVEASYNRTKDYYFSENAPRQISFREGVALTESYENILKYSYELPRMINGQVVRGKNTGKNSFALNTVPTNERLSIPAARDILGHQWEGEMFLLASMEAFSLDKLHIGPDTPINRGDFAKSIIKSMGIEIEREDDSRAKRSSRRKDEEETPPLFKDVNKENRNYEYIEEVAKRGIMLGRDENIYFYPNETITRAEAYTSIMRMLGLVNLAPTNKNYSTGFKDDENIPLWAKDYIYVAKQLDMLDGTDYFYPNHNITKGESARLITNLINYMQEDLRKDYRENLLNN